MTTNDDSVVELLKFRPQNVKNASQLMQKLHEYGDDPSLPAVLSDVKISTCTSDELFGLSHADTEGLRRKADIQPGDVVVLHSRKRAPFTGGSTPMGRLRLALHKTALSLDMVDPPQGFNFLWVTDFPLFQPTSDEEP
jgi:aspartyl-tRNA synthetase